VWGAERWHPMRVAARREGELCFGSTADRGEGERGAAQIRERGSRTRGGGNRGGGDGLQPGGDESGVARSASQPGAARAWEAGGRWLSGPWADSNEAGLGAVQVGQAFVEGRLSLFLLLTSFPINSKAPDKSQSFLTPTLFKFGKLMDKFQANKLPFWPNIQIRTDFELKSRKQIKCQICLNFKGVQTFEKNFITSPKIFPGIIFDTVHLDWLTCIPNLKFIYKW
jgi:hypothetical protein